MKSILKILILILKSKSLFSVYGLRKIRWGAYRKFYNAPGMYVDDRVTIVTAHTNKDAYFICKGNVNIGCDVYIDYSGGIEIKDKIAISEGAQVFTHNHSIHDGYVDWKKNPIIFSPLVIEDCAWIGANAIILPSVNRIGVGAIIAAGAVLTKDADDLGIYAGNPATKIGVRRINEE